MKSPGYLVQTKSGKTGRTFHSKGKVEVGEGIKIIN